MEDFNRDRTCVRQHSLACFLFGVFRFAPQTDFCEQTYRKSKCDNFNPNENAQNAYHVYDNVRKRTKSSITTEGADSNFEFLFFLNDFLILFCQLSWKGTVVVVIVFLSNAYKQSTQ